MSDSDLEQKRQAARLAMSAGRKSPPPLAGSGSLSTSSNNLGESKALEPTKTELEEKKKEARHAMEGAERRRQRELEEAKAREEQIRQQQIDLVKKKRKVLAAQKEDAPTPAQPESGKWDKYREKIGEAQKETAAITGGPTTLAGSRTFSSDIATNLSEQNTSLAQIAIHEKERELSAAARGQAATRKSMSLSLSAWLLALAFLAASLGIMYAAYYIYSQRLAGVQADVVLPLVYAEEQIIIPVDDLTPDEIMSALATAWRSASTRESLIDVYFTTTTVTEDGSPLTTPLPAIDFLAKANLGLPTDFVHFLEPKFMTAIYDAPGKDQEHIFIFNTRSFEHTFDILLREGGEIITALFGKLTPPEHTFAMRFGQVEDVIISNIDTRVIKDSSGNIIALYAFLDRETVVFTESTEAFLKALNAYKRSETTLNQ